MDLQIQAPMDSSSTLKSVQGKLMLHLCVYVFSQLHSRGHYTYPIFLHLNDDIWNIHTRSFKFSRLAEF